MVLCGGTLLTSQMREGRPRERLDILWLVKETETQNHGVCHYTTKIQETQTEKDRNTHIL